MAKKTKTVSNWFLGLLLLLFLAFGFLFGKVMELDEQVAKLETVVETTDAETIEALLATYDALMAAVEVYDENVEIYNEKWDIQGEINADFQRRIEAIINYLR